MLFVSYSVLFSVGVELNWESEDFFLFSVGLAGLPFLDIVYEIFFNMNFKLIYKTKITKSRKEPKQIGNYINCLVLNSVIS